MVQKRQRLVSVVVCLMVFVFLTESNAGLIDRGGGIIYDDVLNVMWLQDANYAKTSSYGLTDSLGRMNWQNAMTWASNLDYGGYDDWRLPQTLPVNGINYNYAGTSYYGYSDEGFNISAPGSTYAGSTGSEMSYMYYNNLGNKAPYSPNVNPQLGWESKNSSFFINIQFGMPSGDSTYWSETIYAPNPQSSWIFHFHDGSQYNIGNSDSDLAFVWAVRDVPEPSTLLLLVSGLIGISGLRRKFKR